MQSCSWQGQHTKVFFKTIGPQNDSLVNKLWFTYTVEYYTAIKSKEAALASVAQLAEHDPANQKVAGSIPGQGTCLGCEFGPWLGPVQEAND